MTDTKKPIDTSWKAVIFSDDNRFYVMFFAIVLVLLVWVESPVIIAWFYVWWWAVFLVGAGIVAFALWVWKRGTTPKFEPVPEPLTNQPWATNPFARSAPTTTTKRSSINQFRGDQRFGLRSSTRPTPSAVDQDRPEPRPVAGSRALTGSGSTTRKPSAYHGLSDAFGEEPKPAYRGLGHSRSKSAVNEKHFCPSCGKETPEGYPHCRRCGAELPE
jgi:hypothetical protein